MINNKGSDWIRCDLHVHTPASFSHEYGDREQDETRNNFLVDLANLPIEFKIIGINDYLTIEGYRRLVQAKADGKLDNIDCILPVIEFRINRFAGESKLRRINYHVIFSDKVSPDTIQNQFLNALSAKYTLEPGQDAPDWDAIISDSSFIELGQMLKEKSPTNQTLQNKSDWKVGFDNFNVDYEDLKKILNRPCFKGKVISAIGKGEWEDYRWDAGGAADKCTIINEADIVFLSSGSVAHHESGKNSLIEQKVNSLLLDCSDAHHYSNAEHKDRVGNCFTWLKAEPSFDGLEQIVFEQEGRISISETHPDTKNPYQVISSVCFVNGGTHFTDKKIKFSPYLNSIIGGKSTGKSLLAGLIVKSSDPTEYERRKGEQKMEDNLAWITEKEVDVDFKVEWKDGVITRLNDDSVSRKITYFPQHYLNSKINDKGVGNKELNKIIRAILAQTSVYADAFTEYELALQEQDANIATKCSGFESALHELQEIKPQAEEKGKSVDIIANITRLRSEFSALKSKFNLSEEEISLHKTLNEAKTILQNRKNDILQCISSMSVVNKEFIQEQLSPYELFTDIFEELGEELSQKIITKLTPFIDNACGNIETVFLTELKLEQDKLEVLEIEITAKESEHKPILDKIKNSAPLSEKETMITQEQIKLDEVFNLENNIVLLNKRILDLADALKAGIKDRLEASNIVTSVMEEYPFLHGDDQLDIEIIPRCKADHIQGLLRDRVKFKSNPSIRDLLGDGNFSDSKTEGYEERVAELIMQVVTNSIELKGDYKISGVLQELLTNTIYLNYDLKLGGDSFSIMSPGKRALALLRVLIELDTSHHPIVLDQPEDDLDNRSVYDGLANYIKNKKNDRQIIVVTHNPNVVVGSDSEYVIVANQSGQETNQDNREFRFEYVYGGLENSFYYKDNVYILEKQGVREHVCEILDGGEAAFMRREKLYSGLKKNSYFLID